ncbi:hypothetical protein KM043_006968 [Ampulex compressa]|nr:hypothetical protein KM043_006968 [Ampulex compressa]
MPTPGIPRNTGSHPRLGASSRRDRPASFCRDKSRPNQDSRRAYNQHLRVHPVVRESGAMDSIVTSHVGTHTHAHSFAVTCESQDPASRESTSILPQAPRCRVFPPHWIILLPP